MDVFKAENLTKRYGSREVVKAISLESRAAEIIGLLGRNGAGKTTTFQMMAGLLKPNGGEIFLNGRNISVLPSNERAQMGIIYLPQENSVFIKTSVENNLNMIFELQKIGREERKTRVTRILEELGLESLRKQSAHSLSGGERRRLEICRSLVLEPKFLLLDEPFTGIDPITIIELQRILLKLKRKGIGIIISDHNVRDTFAITDRAYIIDEGQILIEGTPKTVASDLSARVKFLGKDFKLGQEIQTSLFENSEGAGEA
jgi:lipopolysaccharide export system ATP-binding protein